MAITTDCAEGRHDVCRGAGPNHHCPQTAHLGDQKCACRCHTREPDGERVTTGSEPPFTLRRCRECGAGEIDRPEWQVPLRHYAGCQRKATNVEVVRVVEVEPGHDEQTLCATCGKEVTTGQYVNAVHGLIWHTGCAEPPYDERTVAAVVEEVRSTPSEWVRRVGLSGLAHQLEERFKPSAPGGGNAGG